MLQYYIMLNLSISVLLSSLLGKYTSDQSISEARQGGKQFFAVTHLAQLTLSAILYEDYCGGSNFIASVF